MIEHNDICLPVFVGSVKRNLWTSVLISTKQTHGWKAIPVSSFPLDTLVNGTLLLKYVPKLFFHRSGDLKPVGRERKGFHQQVNKVVILGTVPSARNLAIIAKTVQTPPPINKSIFRTHKHFHHHLPNVVSASHVNKRDTT